MTSTQSYLHNFYMEPDKPDNTYYSFHYFDNNIHLDSSTNKFYLKQNDNIQYNYLHINIQAYNWAIDIANISHSLGIGDKLKDICIICRKIRGFLMKIR